MKIYFHHIEASAVSLDESDLDRLFEICSVPRCLLNEFTTKSSGTRVITWKDPATGKEAIAVSIPKLAYCVVKLHGAFFDQYPDFPVHEFWKLIKGKQGNCLKTDISFEDTEKALDFEQIRSMSSTHRINFIWLDNKK